MDMQPTIEPLPADQIDALVPLCRAFCWEIGAPFDDERVRNGLAGLFQRPHFGSTLVLVADGRPRGYVVVTLGWSLESGGIDALLDEVYLEPELRGRGVGTKLVEAAVEAARAAGAKRIYLEVEAGNAAARRLYARLGWRTEESTMMLRWLGAGPAAGGDRVVAEREG